MSYEKTFEDVPVKRLVQNMLFQATPSYNQSVIGLAGTNPEFYKGLLQMHFQPSKIILVDNQIERDDIIFADLIDCQPEIITDCDFCSTIVTCGETFVTMYERMQKLYTDTSVKKIIAFTFCVRMKGGVSTMLDWLNDNLYHNQLEKEMIDEISIPVSHLKHRGYLKVMNHKQYKFHESVLIKYRDTSNMLSGIVSWY